MKAKVTSALIKKIAMFFGVTVFLLPMLLPSFSANALTYESYIYDSYGNSVSSLSNYKPEAVFSGKQLGTTNLNAPADLFVEDTTGTVYILDRGNNRILILDRQMSLIGELSRFILDGEEVSLKEPSSLFVKPTGEILISDTGNDRILVSDPEGKILQVITKPESDLYPANIRFAPKRLVADSQGNIYVIITGLYEGAALFNAAGEFQRFFGSNEVALSAELLWDYLWKQVMSGDQKEALARYVPVEFISFDIDKEGFVHTVTQDSSNQKMIRKLNFLGESTIYEEREFGDLESEYDKRNIITRFYDICVDGDGNTFALDLTRGHIFQYNSDFKLVGVFGSLDGAQEGTFRLPCAIDTLDDRVLVLDSDMGMITVFAPTAFGKEVLAALKLYRDGYYEEALVPWKNILAKNENYYLAYQGIGDGQYMMGQYREAMESYRLAADRNGYLKAFREYRNIFLRQNFIFVFAGVVVLLVGIVVAIRVLDKQRRLAAAGQIAQTEKLPNPFFYSIRVLVHPIDSFETMKEKGLFSLPASLVILALFFLATVIAYLYTGFGYNLNDPHDLNIAVISATTIGLFLLWVLSNYLFCTLNEGKGFFREVWCASAYALLPHIVLSFVVTAISNAVVTEEYTLLQYVGVAGTLWSVCLMVIALKSIHQYSIVQTLGSMVLTVLGIAICVFLLVLSFTVYNQVYSIFESVVRELMFRF